MGRCVIATKDIQPVRVDPPYSDGFEGVIVTTTVLNPVLEKNLNSSLKGLSSKI